MSSILRRIVVHVVLVTVAVLVSTTLVAPGASARAAGMSAGMSGGMSASTRAHLLHVAASKKGAPYRYGAAGPRAFDCSGYTHWVFGRLGRHLPRTSAAQSAAVRHVRASQRRTGDLVFFHSGGRVYHVGIYAGRGRIWHAPHSGDHVRLARIWTRAVSYGRVS